MGKAPVLPRKRKVIIDEKTILLLFGLCWMVYFTTYLGRLNYSSAMTDMIAAGVLSKSQGGSISMIFFFCYGGGQLINGFLGDRLSPRMMIFTGLAVSALCNLCMATVFFYPAMLLAWGVNGYAQSMIWPPIIHIFAEYLDKRNMVKCCVNITSTIAMGTLASYLLSAGMISIGGWKAVFYAAAVILCAVAFVWKTLFRRVERFAGRYGVEEAPQQEDAGTQAPAGAPSAGLIELILRSGLLFILIPVIVHGVLKDGVTSWVPTFISETFHASPVLSILATTILPVVNLTGAYAADFMNKKVFHNEVKTSSFFFFVALSALCGLYFGGNFNMVFSIVMLSIITSSMLAINTLLINLVPLHYGKIGRSSTVSGFLNCTAYIGSAISTFTIGLMVERNGWSFTILSWVVITAAAFVLCVLSRKVRFEYRPRRSA